MSVMPYFLRQLCGDESAARALQHLGILGESGDDPAGKLDRAAGSTVELRCHTGDFFQVLLSGSVNVNPCHSDSEATLCG